MSRSTSWPTLTSSLRLLEWESDSPSTMFLPARPSSETSAVCGSLSLSLMPLLSLEPCLRGEMAPLSVAAMVAAVEEEWSVSNLGCSRAPAVTAMLLTGHVC